MGNCVIIQIPPTFLISHITYKRYRKANFQEFSNYRGFNFSSQVCFFPHVFQKIIWITHWHIKMECFWLKSGHTEKYYTTKCKLLYLGFCSFQAMLMTSVWPQPIHLEHTRWIKDFCREVVLLPWMHRCPHQANTLAPVKNSFPKADALWRHGHTNGLGHRREERKPKTSKQPR